MFDPDNLADTTTDGGEHTLSVEPSSPKIDGYDVLERLGRGGTAIVYRARQIELNRIVALKLLAYKSSEAHFKKRFEIEAQAIAKLGHPNIAQIYDVGISDVGPFLALEFLPGGTLAERLKEIWSPRDAANLIETLANAISYSHREGVIHRDLKPANILFDARDQPKIVDFGLARITDHTERLTETSSILGTPAYMSPEQASGVVKNVGAPSDIYALGTILYELLTGRPPFITDNYTQTIMLVLSQEPVPPRRLQPRIPRDLETICLRCLQKRVKRRYSSAGDLADDLNRFLSGRPIHARRIGIIERAYLWAQRRPVAAFFIGLSAMLLFALLVGSLVYNSQLQSANRSMIQQRDRSERLFRSGQRLAEWVLYQHAQDLRSVRGTSVARQALSLQLKQYLDQLQGNAEGDTDLSEELAAAYEQLAMIQGDPYQQNLGNAKSALASYEAALSLRKQLFNNSKDPQTTIKLAQAYSNVGATSAVLGQTQAAMEAYRECQRLLEKVQPDASILGTLSRAKASTLIRIGDVLESKAQWEEAEAAYNSGLEQLQQDATSVDPDQQRVDSVLIIRSRLLQLAIDRFRLGDQDPGKISKYFAAFRDSLDQFQVRHQDDPVQTRELAHGLRIYADYLREIRDEAAAIEIDQRVLKLFRQQSELDPRNATLVRDVCISLSRVGSYYLDHGEFEKASKHFNESLQLTTQLADNDPGNVELMNDQWVNHYDLGTSYMFQDKFNLAEPHFERCQKLAQSIIQADSSQTEPSFNDLVRLAQASERMGTLMTLRGNASDRDAQRKAAWFQQARTNFSDSLKYFDLAGKRQPLSAEVLNAQSVVNRMITQLNEYLGN